jgi:putative peptidoglycan lipid II flippase
MPPSTNNSAARQIARAAGIVMLAFGISNLVGLARNMIVIRVFGASEALDSFYAANRIAETLFNLMAGGALGSAFIPTFTGLLTRDDRPGAWRLASAVANLLLAALTLASLLAAVFAPQIVRYGLFALDPASDPVQEAQTAHLLRILLPSVVIFGLSGLVMGILNASQVFLVPAIAPAMYSLGWILGVFLLPEGWGIERLAWGAVLGAGLHLLVQLPNLARLRGRYTLSLGLDNSSVREVASLMGPRLFGVAVVQLNFFVNTIIALSLPDGSVSAIGQGFALMLMPQAAIAQSIAIAAMPTFSAQVARGQQDEMRAALAATLRGVLLLAIPASLGLILLRQPVVNLLYREGACEATCAGMIAWALLWYALGLVGHSLVEITSRAFYALHDTRTPVLVGVAAMTLNVVFSLAFARLFQAWGLAPHGGLALANSLATGLEAAALLALMRRRLGGLEGSQVLRAGLAGAAATAGMGAALLAWTRLPQPDWALAAGGILLGGLLYGGLLPVLRVREVGALASALRRLARRNRNTQPVSWSKDE